jgi:hypothetical protein
MIFGPGNQQSFCWMPIQTSDLPLMARQGGFFDATGKVEYLDCGIVAGRGKLCIRGGKGQSSDGFIVSLNLLDVVEIGLPILDDAILVGRDEPVLVVGIGYCSYGCLVGLMCSLELIINN